MPGPFFMKTFARLFATTFFSGYSPVAPGTVGALIACAAYLMIPGLRGLPLALSILAVFFIGIWAADREEASSGHDAPVINIDEVAGMWITLWIAPSGAVWAGVAFLLFRVMDIVKPFPVNRSQALRGGWGIMADDVLAGLYAGTAARLLLFVFRRLAGS